MTQSSTLPNDPNLFRGATTAAVVDVARNHAGSKIGNSFPGDWNDRKECGAGSPPLSNLSHPHSRMGDINFIAKSNRRCIASSGSSCCDFRRENPHFLVKIHEKRCNDGNCWHHIEVIFSGTNNSKQQLGFWEWLTDWSCGFVPYQ